LAVTIWVFLDCRAIEYLMVPLLLADLRKLL
jgi:hypothetical protein